MRALVIGGPDDISIVDKPAPEIGPSDLLLAPMAVGICGTDLELAHGDMVYLREGMAKLPITPGHEWVARVEVVGEEVEHLSRGDLVVGECSIGCTTCKTCMSGNYHQCPNRFETGILNLDGAMSGLFRFPARSAHKVRDDIDVEDAVFAEPSAVALRAVKRAEIAAGQSVLIVGAGTIGWLIAAIALDLGADDVAIMEPEQTRLQRALDLGCRKTGIGEAFDVVFEASGNPKAIQAGLEMLAPSGRYVAVGLSGHAAHPVDVDRIVVRDQTITGSLGSPGVWQETLAMLGRGRLKPSMLVTGRYSLSDAADAYRELGARKPDTGKLLIIPCDDDRHQQ